MRRGWRRARGCSPPVTWRRRYPGGLDPAVESAGLPHGGLPKNQKEADLVFSRIEAVLREAGTGLENIVRVDQYYPTHTAVDHYHVVRRKRLPTVPPSTSMLMRGAAGAGRRR